MRRRSTAEGPEEHRGPGDCFSLRDYAAGDLGGFVGYGDSDAPAVTRFYENVEPFDGLFGLTFAPEIAAAVGYRLDVFIRSCLRAHLPVAGEQRGARGWDLLLGAGFVEILAAAGYGYGEIYRGGRTGAPDIELDRWRRLRLVLPPNAALPQFPGIVEVGGSGRLPVLTTNSYEPAMLSACQNSGATVQAVDTMTLEEIFVANVQRRRDGQAA